MNIQPTNSSAVSSVVSHAPDAQASAVRQAQFAETGNATPVDAQKAVDPTKKTQASGEEVQAAVKSINDFVKTVNNGIEFTVDNDTGRNIVKVIDNSTKQVIRQFPSEEALAIAKALDKVQGLLVQQKA